MSVTNGVLEIEPGEILNHISDPEKKGKYITYRLAEDRWIAIDKTAEQLRTAMFEKQPDALVFLNGADAKNQAIEERHGFVQGSGTHGVIETESETVPFVGGIVAKGNGTAPAVVVEDVQIFDPKTAEVPVEPPQTDKAQPNTGAALIDARLKELRQYGLKFDYKENALIYKDAENLFYFPAQDIQCDGEEVWVGKMETLKSKLKPVAVATAATVPAEPSWMEEALQNGSDEPEGDEYIVEAPETSKADELRRLAQNVTKIEGEYFNRLRTFNDLEAELKRLMNDFDLANAELIDNKKAASAAKLQAENDLKQALCEWGALSADKTFDQYLSVMETSNYEIDEAEATTWAQTNYPAALNTVLNQKLIIDYIKKSKKFLSFVKVTKQVAAKISRKV
jgi:hypothetical protein